jgi:uncharacterized membrane protein YdjX (TVP38/TMEM64 family)
MRLKSGPATWSETGPVKSRRLVTLSVLVLVAVLLVLARPLHTWLLSLFDQAELAMREREVWGVIIFVLLAALSAMIAFVSSAVLVPAAIYVWGPVVCFLLLWVGWFLGGLAGYAVGRYFGRPVVERLVRPGALKRYEGWARSGKSLVLILLVLMALPSDLASYVFGMVRSRFIAFVTALAIAEVPYALGAVYLGASFLERRIVPLVGLGLAGALLSLWAIRRIHGRAPPIQPDPPMAGPPLLVDRS